MGLGDRLYFMSRPKISKIERGLYLGGFALICILGETNIEVEACGHRNGNKRASCGHAFSS
jgi:hypothetical protein